MYIENGLSLEEIKTNNSNTNGEDKFYVQSN